MDEVTKLKVRIDQCLDVINDCHEMIKTQRMFINDMGMSDTYQAWLEAPSDKTV